MMRWKALFLGTMIALIAGVARADVPRLVSYQGRIAGEDAGPVNLRLALYDAAAGGNVLFSESHNATPLNNGIFSVLLGANTNGGIPDSAFDETQVWLETSVDAVVLTPRTRIAMVPYAAKATSAERLVRPDTFTAIAQADSSGRLNFTTGDWPLMTAGHDNVVASRMWIGHSTAFPTWGLQYRDLALGSFPADALEIVAGNSAQPRFGFALSSGIMRLYDGSGDAATNSIQLDATSNSGGEIRIREALGNDAIVLDADAPNGGGLLEIYGATGFVNTITLDGNINGSGFLALRDSTGDESASIDGNAGNLRLGQNLGQDGDVQLYPNSGASATVHLNGEGAGNSGEITLGDGAVNTIELMAAEVAGDGAQAVLRDAAGVATIVLDAEVGDVRGTLDLRDTAGNNRLELRAMEAAGDGAQAVLRDAAGAATIVLDAEVGDQRGAIDLRNNAGFNRIEMRAMEAAGQGAQINMRDNSGVSTITLDAEDSGDSGGEIIVRNGAGDITVSIEGDFAGTGTGRIQTQVLEVTGADLAEKFPTSEQVDPGMVVAIDPNSPGRLCLARSAYDRRVAGVVSGANNFSVGAILGNLPGHENAPAVALSGRVYVNCTAANGPIQPGDLLTTADEPGHAMRVTDHARAQGAIIGKAMTGLESGKGMVLVLVSLQ